jgi:anaerobic glycerol-3-phosphate dehydrogenase C subunit
MDSEQLRIAEDLRGQIDGDVLCDDVSMQMYACDASIYEIRPQCVVRPRSTSDVATVVRYAAENQISLHPRGAGSGLAGESLGAGIVIDFSRYMRRIVSLGVDEVRVQSGVIHGELNRHLAQHGRIFGPDPATTDVTTMAGSASVDAAGSRWRRYGSFHDHVTAMKVVLADGEVVELSQHSRKQAAEGESPALRRLVEGVADLVETQHETIVSRQPKSLVNRSGYALHSVLDGDQVNMSRLLVGSEGTLGFICELSVNTQMLPEHQKCALLVFDSLDKAAHCIERLLPLEPSACDLMDRRHLSLAREADVRYELLIPQAAEAVLLIEASGDEAVEVGERLQQMIRVAAIDTRLAAGAHVADDDTESVLFWNLARRFVPTLYKLQGRRRAVPCIEDIAVPVHALPVFLRHLQDTLKREEVTASVFGHAGHGQLHVRPLLDLTSPTDIVRMEKLASELYEKVWLLGGTISGEHGDGLSRTPFLSRQFGPLMNVFRELKRMFDPQGIMNPGKKVPLPGMRMTHNLRRTYAGNDAAAGGSGALQPTYGWELPQLAHAARSCNGCAACRTRSESTRMCPTNRIGPSEEASPRAKANLLRAVAAEQLPIEALATAEMKKTIDLCVHCHMCRIECPASVDIPQVVAELKASYVKTNGLTMHDWFMANIDRLSQWASITPRTVNRILGSRRARWLLDKLLGIAPGRSLPRYARKSFLKTIARRKLDRLPTSATHKVAYFVDTYANFFEPKVANHFVALLEHNGVGVVVPPSQYHSGMPLVAFGAIDEARRVARRNVSALVEAVRAGCTIVATEPTATIAITKEYPHLLGADDQDVRLVTQNTMDAADYLWKLHQQGALRLDFSPLDYELAYHAPCHVLALEVGTPAINLLRLIPSLRLHYVQKGCSGMAGTYGIQSKTYRNSLRIGLPLISEVRDGSFDFATTDCSSCKLQLAQGTQKEVLHPVTLLAMAYGLASTRELPKSGVVAS